MIAYSPTNSFVNSSFFTKLSSLKLETYKLDSSAKEIFASVGFRPVLKNQGTHLSLNGESLESLSEVELTLPSNSSFIVAGSVYNTNTVEQFKQVNKSDFLQQAGHDIFKSVVEKSFLKDVSLLSKFRLLSFCDLKKYKFFYWFAFPTLESDWTVDKIGSEPLSPESVSEYISGNNQQVFLIEGREYSPLTLSDTLHLGFVDTSTGDNCPSVTLKNLLFALAFHKAKTVTVSVFRLAQGTSFRISLTCNEPSCEMPKVTGWERTSQGKLGPKVADLGALVDPVQLADQSVDLNLKLMKWCLAPDLNLDVISSTKCLILGAGTLGSYITRALLGWGVRSVSFVDNSYVSYSNPVRQPLYKFSDCVDGGKYKCQAAADAVKEIFPLVESHGYNLEIPMAGHPVTDEPRQKRDFEKLVSLIEEHDVIFLVLDSRETRWLPAVVCAAKSKIVINAALGFDSYLVMRHGHYSPNTEDRLGCYFCNDVFAPSDSTTDQTLDQQCTVTRPGVALMASSLAVEIMVSVLQHPLKDSAPPVSTSGVLGEIPHQIRGFLRDFSIVKLSAPSYKYCSCCSDAVIEAFERDGWEFVKLALNDSRFLEDLTGLTKVQQEAEEAVKNMEVSDDEW